MPSVRKKGGDIGIRLLSEVQISKENRITDDFLQKENVVTALSKDKFCRSLLSPVDSY